MIALDQALFADTAAALAELDFSAENAEITELQAEIERVTSAIDRARQHVAQLGQEELRQDSGHAVAEALLSGSDPDEAATVMTAAGSIAERKAALLRAIPELTQQAARARDRIATLQGGAERRVAEVARPLVDALMSQAKGAAEQLAETFAALSAVSFATKAGAEERSRLSTATHALFSERLLAQAKTLAVPAEVQSLEGPLSGKGPAFPHKHPIVATVGRPENPSRLH